MEGFISIPYYLVIAAVGFSFYASFMGGANDFANSFGTSIGSGAITVRQAVLIAIISSLIGAVLVGGHVTDTVRKGIIDTSLFENAPNVLILGLFSSLIGAGIFLNIATYLGLPVSTTHTIVGAILGFGLITNGIDSVNWSSLGMIALSWIISPIGGGILAYTTFRIIQARILKSNSPIAAATMIVPFFVAVTVIVLILAMIYKGLKNVHLDLTLSDALLLSAIIGTFAGGIVWLVLKKIDFSGIQTQSDQNKYVERIFKYLQIFTAGYVAFAHGSNDVANGIGPLAGIWTIYHEGMVGLKTQVPMWILTLGGIGIVSGLAVFGHRVIETVGKKITLVTPSRGFSAEFSAATIVLVFSKLGMPVSTTHTLVGSVIGVGLARGLGALDMRVVSKIFTSWLVTIPMAAISTALTFWILKAIYIQ